MPEHPEYQFNGKTRLTVPLASWVHVILLIATIVACYFGLAYRVDRAVEQGTKNAQDISEAQRLLYEIRMDLGILHQRYEDDMRRYIRDYSDQPKQPKH